MKHLKKLIIGKFSDKPESYGIIFLFLIVVVIYGKTLSFDFTWDDKIVLTENSKVQQGIAGIDELFIKSNAQLRESKYGYRPISLMSLALEYELFENKASGYHFMNVIYYLLLCFSLYFFINRMTKGKFQFYTLFVVILFAVHPLHVEVVANIKSRDEILMFLFGTWFLYYFFLVFKNFKWPYLLLSILFFTLSYLSKENAVGLLPIAFFSCFFHDDVKLKKMAIAGVAVAVLVSMSLFIFKMSESSTQGTSITEGMAVYEEDYILGNAFSNETNTGIKFANALQLQLEHLKKFFFPVDLTFYSGTGTMETLEVHWKIFLSFAILLISIFLFFKCYARHKLVSLGILWFYAGLLLFLQLFVTLADHYADRFAFVSSFGLCLVTVYAIFSAARLSRSGKAWKPNFSQKIIMGIIGVGVLAFAKASYDRTDVWKNDWTLVSQDLPKLKDSPRVNYFMASLMNDSIQNGGSRRQLEKAMVSYYKKAINLSDRIYYGRLELALYFLDNNQEVQGVKLLKEMTELFPDTADPFFYLGSHYYDIKMYAKAVDYLERCLTNAPRSADAIRLKALAHIELKELPQAEQTIKIYQQRFPSDPNTYYELEASYYFAKSDGEKAAQASLKRIDYGADPFQIYATIIGRFQSLNDNEKALRYYQEALSKGIMSAQ